MEDTPLVIKHDTDNKESRRHKDGPEEQETRKFRAKKPEAIGVLAVKPKPERLPAEKPNSAENKRSPGHIGHMLLTSEAKPDERHQKPSPEIAPLPAGKRIDTLNRAELMVLGERVIINDSNLRQMYETHLIGERGLRRLVAEHLRGGNLRKALRNEVLEREMDFERDPALRDLAAPAIIPADSTNVTLEKLLQKAAVNVADSGEEAAFFKARARYEAVHQQQDNKHRRRFIDISLSLIIIILITLVIFMFLVHN